jgi:ABC-type glutathione transport system ATPase component
MLDARRVERCDLLLRSNAKFRPEADDGDAAGVDPRTMRSGETQAAITVEGLTKRYGELTAVDALSFSVRRGSVAGFLGPNGAGKTTALKAIAGIARPTSGHALINGIPVGSAHAGARVLGVYIEPTGAHPGRSATTAADRRSRPSCRPPSSARAQR